MALRVALEYGLQPYPAVFPGQAQLLEAPTPGGRPAPLSGLLRTALGLPIAAESLAERARSGDRILAIVSDATRREPRDAFLRAVIEHLPDDIELSVAIATGTHGPCVALDRLGIGADLHPRIARWIDHDGHDPRGLVRLGETTRGTPVTVHSAVVEADLVVATGCITPHYFAGYGGGIKAIFPGLGGNREIRINHRLKESPGSRAGVVAGNPCREDLEEVTGMLPRAPFLLNAVLDAAGEVRGAVAGDVLAAFRAGARACEALHRARAPRARCVVVSDAHPVTSSLYQASKLVAAAAPLLAPGGTVVVVAECGDGVGPLEIVNQGIYEIGIRPRLPREHRIVLVSSLSRAEVEATYCEWAPSLEAALASTDGGDAPLVLPRAGSLLCEAVE